MKVKTVGFFKELRHGYPTGPSLRDAVRKPEMSPDIPRIVAYLQNATVFVACPGGVSDVLKETGQIIGSPQIRTDGVWAWPNDLAYYVMNYHIELPKEFVEHMKASGWQAPSIDRVQLMSLEL